MKKPQISATVTVEWGYELHSLTLTPRNWSKIKQGKPHSQRGKGYCYEGVFLWDYWEFGGGLDGRLEVGYGDDRAAGFIGKLSEAEIEEGPCTVIPPKHLASTKEALHYLIDERTSAPWAAYSEHELAKDAQDCEDIERIKTVLDLLQFLRDQGGRECFVEWASCLDPLDGFTVEGKEDPDSEDESAFRDYLTETYGIEKSEF